MPPPFNLSLMEQLTQQKSTEQRDGYLAGVAAVFALAGVGLGAWLGSRISIQLALFGAVGGAIVAPIAGLFLGNAIFSKR